MLPLLPLLSIARGHDSRDHTIPGSNARVSPEQGVSGGETLGTRMLVTTLIQRFRTQTFALFRANCSACADKFPIWHNSKPKPPNVQNDY